MSAYTTIATQIVSARHLAMALRELGFAAVEVHDSPEILYGFQDDARPQRAEVIVRREHVGSGSNDIGFARGANGTFTAYISDFDRETYGAAWLGKLTQRYAYHVAREQLEGQGFSLIEEEVDATETVRLTLRRSA